MSGLEDDDSGSGDEAGSSIDGTPDLVPQALILRKYLRISVVSAVAGLSSLTLGYDLSVMSGALVLFSPQLRLSSLQQSTIVSSLNFLAMPGALLGGYLCDAIGRRATLGVIAVMFIIGSGAMAVAFGFLSLLLGRCIAGLALGAALITAPLYIAESAPPHLRGVLVSIAENSINIGIAVGYIANYALSFLPENISWRMMLGVGSLVSAGLFVMVLFIPESPRWLLNRGRSTSAYRSIRSLSASDEEARLALMQLEERLGSKEHTPKAEWKLFFDLSTYSLPLIKRVLAGFALAVVSQIVGIEAVLYYTPQILKAVPNPPSQSTIFLATVGLGVFKTAATVLASLTVDWIGRRKLLLVSAWGVLVSLFGATVVLWLRWPAYCVLMALYLYVSMFAVGYGVCAWIVMSEIFPQVNRGVYSGISTMLNRGTAGMVAILFPLAAAGWLGMAGVFALLTLVAGGALAVVALAVPETGNRSLEEIGALFGDESVD